MGKKNSTISKCAIFVSLSYFIANGMTIFSVTPQYDAINHLLYNSGDWQISLGRFLIPYYECITRYRRGVTEPLIISILSMTFISLCIYMILDISEECRTNTILALSLLLTSNMVMTSFCCTFKFFEDVFQLANLLMCTGVWVHYSTNEFLRYHITESVRDVLSCALFFCGFAVYPASISYAFMIIAIVIMKQIIGGNIRIRQNVSVILTLVISTIMYILVYFLIMHINGFQNTNNYNSISSLLYYDFSKMLISIKKGYLEFVDLYFVYGMHVSIVVTIGNVIITILYIMSLARAVNKMNIKRILFVTLVNLLIPLICMTTFIFMEVDSSIYVYRVISSVMLVYALQIIIIVQNESKHKTFVKVQHKLLFFAIALISIMNIRYSNGAFTVKKILYDRGLSQTTRILYDLSKIEGYQIGKTRVVLIGEFDWNDELYDISGDLKNLSGFGKSNIAYPQTFAYFCQLMGEPINLDYSDQSIEYYGRLDEVKHMRHYPYNGYIKYIEDTVVIKLFN